MLHLPVQPGHLHDRLQACTNNPSANRGVVPISHEGVGHPRLWAAVLQWRPTVVGLIMHYDLGCMKLVKPWLYNMGIKMDQLVHEFGRQQ